MTVPAFNQESAKLVHFYHLAEHVYNPPTEPLPVSFIPPNAYWTSADKSAFFQSLARHSRWRPDLISDEIGNGKSVADICSYIELLEQGLREAPNTSRSRNTLPIAREVSDDWMHAEESMAQALREEDGEWQKYALKRKRAEDVKLTKESLRVDRDGDAQEYDGAAVTPDSIPHAPDSEEVSWQERLRRRKQDFVALWKREDLLSSLRGKYLKAMESMVQALEEVETERKLEGLKETHQTPLPDSVAQIFPVPPLSIPSDITHLDTDPYLNSLNHTVIDNSQIDPALIALDLQPTIRPMQPHDPPVQLPQPPVSSYNGDPGPSGLHANLQHPPSSPARASSHDSDPLDHTLDLSPVSRRRIRKRLWMRRKRALQSGLSVSEVSTDIRKLKPGRKGKLHDKKGKSKAKLSDGSEGDSAPWEGRTDTLENQDEDDDTDDSDSIQRKKSHGWNKLESLLVDGSFLRKAGLDLFRLSNFSGFMSLINDVYRRSETADDDDEGEGGVPTLSYSFLLMLRANLTYFITRLIGQILAQKRIDTQQKKRVRNGPHTGRALKIKAKNVHEALGIMGHSETKKRFFRRLRNRIRDTTDIVNEDMGRQSKQSPDSGASTPSETDSGSDSETEDGADVSDGQSGDGDIARQPSLPRKFVPQSEFQQIWNFIGDWGDGTLILDDLDENAVSKELAADDEVDKRDQGADRELEDSLWEEIGVQRYVLQEHPEQEAEAEPSGPKVRKTAPGDKPPKGAKSIRFRKPGGAIKSSVFIEDSSDDDGWESPQ